MIARVASRTAVFTLALLAALGSPRAQVRAQEPHTLRIGLVQQPNSLDPLHAIEFYENYLDEALYSALVVIDDRGEPSADLAERVPTRANGGISSDGKTLTYRLRPHLRWQDGVPLTSRDVAYTFARMMDPKSNFTETATYAAIDRIQAPDDRTVVVRLKAPWADATTQLFVGGQNGSILPQHVLEHIPDLNGSSFESQPMGSGPYRLERWERGNRLVLRANESYFLGKPKLERVEIDFVPDSNTIAIRMRTGELDFSPQITPTAALQLRAIARLAFRAVPTYTALELEFNTTAAPFTDARVREALAAVVDRRRLVQTTYHGLAIPADDLVPPQSSFHVRDASVRQDGDAAAAARLLDAAGWRMGESGLRRKNGSILTAALVVPAGYASIASAAVQIQAAWRALGVDASIRPLQANIILATDGPLASGAYGVSLITYGFATSPDRSTNISSGAIGPNGRNYSRVRDPQIDAWTQSARVELDAAKRVAIYARISKRIRRSAVFVPLLWLQQAYVRDARFAGLRPEPINSDMWNAYAWSWGLPGR